MRKLCLFMMPLLLIAASCLTTGCSTHAMRAVPVFKSDPNPEASEIDLERVNAWPLYYKDGDVRSAFWPLYTKAADGHALVPFYEYRKGDRSLRLGQITHLLPALASFEPERNDSWRVLLAYKEKTVSRLGSYTRNPGDGFVLLPPFLFWNGETLWTPVVARGKGQDHSMWGLLYQFYALAPLIGGWRGDKSTGAQLVPLFYYNGRKMEDPGKKSTTFNLGVVLAHYHKNAEENKRIAALAWPLFHHYQKNEKSEPDYRSRTNVALLGFHNSRNSSARYTYLLWPLVQNADHGHTSDGEWNGGWLNVLGLVFHRSESPRSSHTMFLWPFFQSGDRGVDAQGNSRGKWMNVLGLVAHRYRSSDISSGHFLWPLWYHRVRQDQDQRVQAIAKGMDFDYRRETLSHRFALAGLYAQRREVMSRSVKVAETEGDVEAGKVSRVDQRIRDHWRLFPLLWSERFDTGEGKFLVLWRLYDSRRVPLDSADGEWRRERVLWRLYRREERGTRTAVDSFPFMSSARDTATGFRRWTLAGGLYERRTEDGVRSTKLLWIPVSRREVRQD
jgi:hypothetical protein